MQSVFKGTLIVSEPIITHVGFSDESNWNQGRFRSLGLITTPMHQLKALEDETKRLLHESNMKEFKWKKLGGAKERFAAIKLCKHAIGECRRGKLRIDVLIWDIEDRRHKVLKRDDIANLQRMYYHLFKNVFRARWPNQATWRLHPDEHTAMDWDTVGDCLKHVSARLVVEQDLFSGEKFKIRLQRDFGIGEISPSTSRAHPLLNVIDLFAGLAAFSYEKYDQFAKWERNHSHQKTLFHDANGENDFHASHISEERFKVLSCFNSDCKNNKLGVSLSEGGLRTPNPARPINFWLYKAQHPLDQAPQKGWQ